MTTNDVNNTYYSDVSKSNKYSSYIHNVIIVIFHFTFVSKYDNTVHFHTKPQTGTVEIIKGKLQN